MAKTAQQGKLYEVLSEQVPKHRNEDGKIEWDKIVPLVGAEGLKTTKGNPFKARGLSEIWNKMQRSVETVLEQVSIDDKPDKVDKPNQDEMMVLLRKMFDNGTLARIHELYEKHNTEEPAPNLSPRKTRGTAYYIPLLMIAQDKMKDDLALPSWLKRDSVSDLVNYLLWKYVGSPENIEIQPGTENEPERA